MKLSFQCHDIFKAGSSAELKAMQLISDLFGEGHSISVDHDNMDELVDYVAQLECKGILVNWQKPYGQSADFLFTSKAVGSPTVQSPTGDVVLDWERIRECCVGLQLLSSQAVVATSKDELDIYRYALYVDRIVSHLPSIDKQDLYHLARQCVDHTRGTKIGVVSFYIKHDGGQDGEGYREAWRAAGRKRQDLLDFLFVCPFGNKYIVSFSYPNC